MEWALGMPGQDRTGQEGGFGGRRGYGIPSPLVAYIRSEGERRDTCLEFLSVLLGIIIETAPSSFSLTPICPPQAHYRRLGGQVVGFWEVFVIRRL